MGLRRGIDNVSPQFRLNLTLGDRAKDQTMTVHERLFPERCLIPAEQRSLLYDALDRQERLLDAKVQLEAMWPVFAPLADSNFSAEFPRRTQDRFWEMYLGTTFLGLGLEVSKPSEAGPDFCVHLPSGRLWIEAVSCGAGEGPDALEEPPSGEAYQIPEQQILLRLLTALSSKLMQFGQYRESGIVQESDSCVIAINGANVPYVIPDDYRLPYIVQAVLPFGPPTWQFDKEGKALVWRGHLYQGSVTKKSGTHVPTTAFLNPSNAWLSGVLYSRMNPLNMWRRTEDDLLFVHNCTATTKRLPLGWFQSGREYWIERNQLQQKHWFQAKEKETGAGR